MKEVLVVQDFQKTCSLFSGKGIQVQKKQVRSNVELVRIMLNSI
jgi:hypothetical protein